jgi:hypothetical protein
VVAASAVVAVLGEEGFVAEAGRLVVLRTGRAENLRLWRNGYVSSNLQM